MRVNLHRFHSRTVTRENIYKQYTEVMSAIDVLQEQIYYLQVDNEWKKKHVRDIFIRYLNEQDTEGYGGLDSVIYNTLWEVMEEHEEKEKLKQQATSASTSPQIDHTDEEQPQ
jgi:hypothetical protein